jgi:hypothetical protein
MGHEVEGLEWELKSLQLRNELLENLRNAEAEAEKQRKMKAALEPTSLKAVQVHREYSIITGLSRFKLSHFSTTLLNFNYLGLCPAACFSISFALHSSTSVKCRAEANPTIFEQPERTTSDSTRALPSRFFETFTPIICAEVSGTTLSGVSMVGEYLRQIDWQVCRLEETAAEVQHLKRRYKVVEDLSSSAMSESAYTVRVDFFNRSQEQQLSVYFDIGRSYPFSWVNNRVVCNGNEFDVEWLDRYLSQHSKSGPGWLARTCDTISAVCQGSCKPTT